MSQATTSYDDAQLGPISDLPLEIRQIIFGYTITLFKHPEDVGLGYIADPFIMRDFMIQCQDFHRCNKILKSYGEENMGGGWLSSVENKWRGEWETCMSEMIEEDKEVWYNWFHFGIPGRDWTVYRHFKNAVEAVRVHLIQLAMSRPTPSAETDLSNMEMEDSYASHANDLLRFREEAMRKVLDNFRYARLEMIAGISRTRGTIDKVLVKGADKRKTEDRILLLREWENNYGKGDCLESLG